MLSGGWCRGARLRRLDRIVSGGFSGGLPFLPVLVGDLAESCRLWFVVLVLVSASFLVSAHGVPAFIEGNM